MPDTDAPDEVVLTLPAVPEFVRLARLTCAGLATRLGMGYDEVEDLRIAVGEACSAVIGDGTRDGRITLRFALVPDALSIEVVGELAGAPDDEIDTTLSDQILDAVVDEHTISIADDRVSLTKRHGSDGATETGPA